MVNKFRVKLQKLSPIEGDQYKRDTEKTIYEQDFEDIDVSELVIFLNQKKEDKNKNLKVTRVAENK